MSELHSHWVPLLNAQESWLTDEAMLSVIPVEARDFSSGDWPRDRALAYLHNHVSMLRMNHERLEAGEAMDPDLINPVLAGLSLRVQPRPQSGGARGVLVAGAESPHFNRGTAAVRVVVHRAVFHFCLYAEFRTSDPAWPGATPGMLRVLRCASRRCGRLVVCAGGLPGFCSPRCAEETARPQGEPA